MGEITGSILVTQSIAADNFNVNRQHSCFSIVVGPSQPVLNSQGMVIGSVAQWTHSLSMSPTGIVQLHALLGQMIEDYERDLGRIPRPVVMFTKTEAATATDKVVTLDGRAVPQPAPRVVGGKLTYCPECNYAKGAGHAPWCTSKEKPEAPDVPESAGAALGQAAATEAEVTDLVAGQAQFCPGCSNIGHAHAWWCRQGWRG